MRTTLIINDNIMKRLREEAAKRNTTISELVEAALRLVLESGNFDKHEILRLPISTWEVVMWIFLIAEHFTGPWKGESNTEVYVGTHCNVPLQMHAFD